MTSWETFFCRNLKNDRMSFLSQCNVQASRASLSCSKTTGFEGGLFQKIFNGCIFYFLGQLFGGQLFDLFACETNLKKQSSVQSLRDFYVLLTPQCLCFEVILIKQFVITQAKLEWIWVTRLFQGEIKNINWMLHFSM